MADKIKVIIADDIRETRENIKILLSFESRIEVIGEAEDGDEAVSLAREARPDIILMDINMPKKDGIRATSEISLEIPETTIIIMSVQADPEYLRKAMTAGARDYVSKPFTGDELAGTILKTYDMEAKRREKIIMPRVKEEIKAKIITVFSTKGGVGKTTIATNLAVAVAHQTKKRVALVDLDLLFGDVAVHLNIPVKRTISELVKEIGNLDDEVMEEHLCTHFSGVKILPAPAKPEYAEYVTALHIEKVLGILSSSYHYIVVDTAQNFNETTLTALDASESILFVSTMDLPTIKNIKTGLEVMDSLRYSPAKIKLVLNKASEQFGITYKDFEETLKNKIWAYVPEDSSTVINATNKGFPFVITRPETRVARSLQEMAARIVALVPEAKLGKEQHKSFMKKIWGL